MPSPLLELRQITKSFGGARALRGVDFDLHAGEVHALLGENGAGKSTLIKIVTGAHQPDRGSHAIAGRQVSNLNPGTVHALGISCIYQQPALFPDLTVAENIGLRLESGSPLRRIDWAERRSRAAELLTRLGAHVHPEREIRTLSMPEQQLVEIACALGAGARIVARRAFVLRQPGYAPGHCPRVDGRRRAPARGRGRVRDHSGHLALGKPFAFNQGNIDQYIF